MTTEIAALKVDYDDEVKLLVYDDAKLDVFDDDAIKLSAVLPVFSPKCLHWYGRCNYTSLHHTRLLCLWL